MSARNSRLDRIGFSLNSPSRARDVAVTCYRCWLFERAEYCPGLSGLVDMSKHVQQRSRLPRVQFSPQATKAVEGPK